MYVYDSPIPVQGLRPRHRQFPLKYQWNNQFSVWVGDGVNCHFRNIPSAENDLDGSERENELLDKGTNFSTKVSPISTGPLADVSVTTLVVASALQFFFLSL